MTDTHAQQRIMSIDILRGLVIMLMALDHVRDMWMLGTSTPLDLNTTTAGLFATRWITHLCAPTFVFLSGVSAWLHATARDLSKRDLSLFLLKRGLWLVFVELIIINFAWQFAYNFLFVQVIWAIGMSMIVLAALVFMPRAVVLVFSLTLIIGHNLLDGITPDMFGDYGWVWNILHAPGWIPMNGLVPIEGVAVAYPLIPWFGVMGLGYGLGPWFIKPANERAQLLMKAGAAALLLFVVLRLTNLYGDPAPWAGHERGGLFSFFSFMNVTKYPASLLFLMITLGPVFVLLPYLENVKGRFWDKANLFGRVPFFFYIIHFFFIHLTAKLWFGVMHGATDFMAMDQSSWPQIGPSLPRAYIAWIVTLFALYPACRWFNGFRKRRKNWTWLSYL